MTSNQKTRVAVVVVLTLLALVRLAPTFFKDQLPSGWPSTPIRLGLDLRGGSYLVLQVQTDEAVKSQLTSIAGQIRAELRKDQAGVLRAKATTAREIEVTLINDRAIEKLDALVSREFGFLTRKGEERDGSNVRITYALGEDRARQIKQDSVHQAIETVRNRVDQYGVAEPTIQRSGEDNIIVQLPDVTDLSQVQRTLGKVAKLEFMLTSVPGRDTETREVKSREGGDVTVEDEVLMTGDAVEKATVEINPHTNEIGVSLKLNAVGGRTFDRITADNVGRNLAIILDGTVYSAPQIRERISGGSASITGHFSSEEAHQLALVIRSGALPAPLKTLEQRTVGATLGADSIHKGVMATLIGSILVVIFMIVYYRKSGVLAVFSLALNILFLLAVLSLFGATLTLPGIAGLGLTVGMAVDANVIIYERIREELKRGANARAAIDAGFLRAHWTILDANLTALLTHIVLYILGTGPIKGFAVTLTIGVLTTMFAALFVSRLAFEVLNLKNSKGELSI